MAGSDLSPRAATLVGLIFIALGLFPILGALHFIALPLSVGVPVWVRVAAGLTFVLGGAAVIVGYAIAGVELDDADAEAGPYGIDVSFAVRVTQYVLALVIYGLFAAIAGWVAFGTGPRNFWLARHGFGNDWMGRAAFGAGAVLVAAAGVGVAVKNFARLKRP
jgi:hypothetical protein